MTKNQPDSCSDRNRPRHPARPGLLGRRSFAAEHLDDRRDRSGDRTCPGPDGRMFDDAVHQCGDAEDRRPDDDDLDDAARINRVKPGKLAAWLRTPLQLGNSMPPTHNCRSFPEGGRDEHQQGGASTGRRDPAATPGVASDPDWTSPGGRGYHRAAASTTIRSARAEDNQGDQSCLVRDRKRRSGESRQRGDHLLKWPRRRSMTRSPRVARPGSPVCDATRRRRSGADGRRRR